MTSVLEILKRETGMSREQIARAIATGYGRFAPDTYARLRSEADVRVVNLLRYMREQRQMITAVPVETAKQAGQLRRLIKKYSPVDTGALKRSWNDPRTVQILPSGQVEIDSPLPYARIQDLGGTIHRVSSKGKPYTIKIPAQHYVGRAIAKYNALKSSQDAPISEVNVTQYGADRIKALMARALDLLTQRRAA